MTLTEKQEILQKELGEEKNVIFIEDEYALVYDDDDTVTAYYWEDDYKELSDRGWEILISPTGLNIRQ